MLGVVSSASLAGIDGQPVRVEVHVSSGFPGYSIVGLPDAPCRESRDRVRAAFLSSGFKWPMRRTTINLAPTSVRKGGAVLDLAIAIGLLIACGELPASCINGVGVLGELGLDGSIRPIPGMLSLVDAVTEDAVIVPYGNVAEASLLGRHTVRTAHSLSQLVNNLRGTEPWTDYMETNEVVDSPPMPDFSDVCGHRYARFGMEVIAAGAHHSLLVGPPGSGKSMLARRLPGILPSLNDAESLITTRVYSVAGLLTHYRGPVTDVPLRAPHHSASSVAVLGGGSGQVRPGEVSLATNGVLLLDEFGEFPAHIVEALRQPLEEGVIRIARAAGCVEFPAQFQLIATMNPCPCGEGLASPLCRCTEASRSRYMRRVSGPILDRIDVRMQIDRVSSSELLTAEPGESSAAIGERVRAARAAAAARGYRANGELSGSQLTEFAPLSPAAEQLLIQRLENGQLSGRGLVRIRRVARTIADLDGAPELLSEDHVAAALLLRPEAAALSLAA